MAQSFRNLGDPYTANNRFAQMLMNQDARAGPVKSHGQGLAQILRMGMAGWMMGQDRRGSEATNRAIAEGMKETPYQDPTSGEALPWTNPDTGHVSTGFGGGAQGALDAVSKVPGEHASRATLRLAESLMNRNQARRDLDETRSYNASVKAHERGLAAKLLYGEHQREDKLRGEDQTNALALEAAKNSNPALVKEYLYAKRNDKYPGTFTDYMMSKGMASQGVVYGPQSPTRAPAGSDPGAGVVAGAGAGAAQPAATGAGAPLAKIVPGGPADVRARTATAAEERNRLAQERIDQTEKAQSPEHIYNQTLQRKKAELKVKQQMEMPGKQSQIVSMYNTQGLMSQTINEAIELGHGMFTGGNTGMVASLSRSSDQSKMERKLLTLRGIVGLDELVYRKEHGATFGALSDTEMALLAASEGVFSGEMEGAELEQALRRMQVLHESNLQEKARQFKAKYPEAERPWENREPDNKRMGLPPGATTEDHLETMRLNRLPSEEALKQIWQAYDRGVRFDRKER